MLSRLASRRCLVTIRCAMLFSGGAPWLLLAAGQSWFVTAMQYQVPMALLIGAYVVAGLYWAAIEKHYIASRKGERLAVSVGRALGLLVIAVMIPVFLKVDIGMAEQFGKQVQPAAAVREASGLLSVLLLWPGIWALICLYALKPVWDHAVEALKDGHVRPVFDFALPASPARRDTHKGGISAPDIGATAT